MDKADLLSLLRFTEFTNLFADVQRKTITNKNGTLENDAQHSFQTALVAWYICNVHKLEVDLERLLTYALVHDLAETYSGNYPAYSRDADTQKAKDSSEQKALKQMHTDFAEFPRLLNAIDSYRAMADEESKFIYALDKFLPLLNIELNNNDFYCRTRTTREQMLQLKQDKIAKHPVVKQYFDLLLTYFSKDVAFFWPECTNRDYSKKTYFE